MLPLYLRRFAYDRTWRSGVNRSYGLAEQFGTLRTVPRIGRVFALLRGDRAIRTSVAFLLDLFIPAVGAVNGSGLVIAVLRAEHIAAPVIDHGAVIEVYIAGVVICGGVLCPALGFAVLIGTADGFTRTHHVLTSRNSQSRERLGAAATRFYLVRSRQGYLTRQSSGTPLLLLGRGSSQSTNPNAPVAVLAASVFQADANVELDGHGISPKR